MVLMFHPASLQRRRRLRVIGIWNSEAVAAATASSTAASAATAGSA